MCHDAAMASTMAGIPMHGGWTMSMMWMRMPGQSWPGAAASFLGMWVGMMVAMMLPSLIPMLGRYRQAVGGAGGGVRLAGLTAVVSVAYYLVWTLFGVALFPLGVGLASLAMRFPSLARVVPVAAGVTLLVAGAIQVSAWKARSLACCREMPGRGSRLAADTRTAWRHGLRLGLQCVLCCVAPTAMLLALGVMNIGAMVVVTTAITVERVLPGGERFARVVGGLTVAAGIFLILRAAGTR
jgi:predicted metal-binding membrane protein